MKKLIFLLIAALSIITMDARHRTDSEGNTVYHSILCGLNYQIGDFDYTTESSLYGVSFNITSFSHWGNFHVGMSTSATTNLGITEPHRVCYNIGPSLRYDLGQKCFINMPIEAMCIMTYPENSTDPQTNWGARVAPALHVFFSDVVGVFGGPQVLIGDGSSSFGAYAGLSFSF